MKQFESLHARERERKTMVKANKAFPIGTHCKGVPLLLEEGKGGKYKKALTPLHPPTPPPSPNPTQKISLQILYPTQSPSTKSCFHK